MKKYLIFLVIIGLASCQKDFLKQDNFGELSPDDFPSDISRVELFVNALYANQHAFGLHGHGIYAKVFYPMEHASDQEWLGDQWWSDIHQNNLRPIDMGEVSNVWRDASRGVTQANTLLGVIPNYREKFHKPADEAQLKLVEGQALYMRAWYRMMLLGFFGETFITNGAGGDKLGIPLVNALPKTQSEMAVKRATVKESLNAIIDDLKKSETLMEGKVAWDGANRTKITSWSVKAMLGKVYIYAEQFADAKTKLKEVIDGSGKTLVDFATYKDMFLGKTPSNSESITEISYKRDADWGTWGISTANNAPMVFEPAVYDAKGTRTFSSWTNIFVHDKNLKRFGFNEPTAVPTPNPAYDPSKPVTLSNLKEKRDDAFLARSVAAKTNGTVDPRLWVVAFQPWVDQYNAFNQMSAIAPVIQSDAEIGKYHSFSFRKYTNLDGRGPDKGMNYYSQMYLMRLADVYLLYAEACAKTADNVNALEYVNKVHRRAYNLPINAPSAMDYASLTASTKAADHPVLRNDPLKYERWAEFFGEGGWWLDVRRWKIGKIEADYYKEVRSGTIKWDDNRSYALPIPMKEFETNPNMVQNPGY